MMNDGIVKIFKDIILKNMLKKIVILNKILFWKLKMFLGNRENIVCSGVYVSFEFKCNLWGNILGYFMIL